MKRFKWIIMGVLVAVLCMAITVRPTAHAVADYSVSGGRLEVNFDSADDLALFDLYTEFDAKPSIVEDRLLFWTLAEQKAILKNKQYRQVDVSATFSTINPNGKYGVGFYVQARDVSSAMDGITAWNVAIEHTAGTSTFTLNLHRFYDGKWIGSYTKVDGILMRGNSVDLRVVVKSGTLYAFLYGAKEPVMSYSIGDEPGMVGMRCFYSPNSVDDLVIIGDANEIDFSELNALIADALALDTTDCAESGVTELEGLVADAQAMLEDEDVLQSEVDAMARSLRKAIDAVVSAHTLQELAALITEAKALVNTDGTLYTQNSWQSLQAVIAICEGLDEDADEQTVSTWYEKLSFRLSEMICFGEEV